MTPSQVRDRLFRDVEDVVSDPGVVCVAVVAARGTADNLHVGWVGVDWLGGDPDHLATALAMLAMGARQLAQATRDPEEREWAADLERSTLGRMRGIVGR
jgi:hypothetical protein